jgi:exopolysaccharide production protein ExoQ
MTANYAGPTGSEGRLVQGTRATQPEPGTAFFHQRLKVVCAVLIAVCFWYSVPYTFPIQLDPDPLKAAANEAMAYEGNLSRQLALPAALVISLVCLIKLPAVGRVCKASRLRFWGVAYLLWAALSLLWTGELAVTRKRLVVFAIDALLAFTLARVTSTRELAWFGFLSTGTVAVIALCADLFVLRIFAPLDPDYRFMGVMTANYQAMNLFVCLVCGLTLVQGRPALLKWLAPLLAAFSVLLFLTRARVGTLLFAVALLIVGCRMARRHLAPHGRAAVLFALLTCVLPSVVYALGRSGQNAVASVFMMGRQDTENTASLSNRAPLWAELAGSVAEHPVLGFGYDAFWTSARVHKISADQGWVVPHAHNSYLDQLLSLGPVGCLLFTGTLFGACTVAWSRYRRQQGETALFSALLLTWLGLLSLTESVPLAPYLPTLIAYSCVVKMCMQDGPKYDNIVRSERRWRSHAVVGCSPRPWTFGSSDGEQGQVRA